MSDVNMFRNMHKNKMNNNCNLWEMNLWMHQTRMQHRREKVMNNIKM
jgi:hypothetical protein